MNKATKFSLFSNLASDLPAGLVVFLVALPLCLGIALSSGAPLFSGIIAGIVGGIVVGFLSGSNTSVSGPAAGLTVIVLNAITELQVFELFLTAVFLAGAMQIALGYLKAGIIGYYFPTSVIKGMLAGIGIILIIKQIPYAFGVNTTSDLAAFIPFVNDFKAVEDLGNLTHELSYGALIITIVSMAIMLLWERPFVKKNKVLTYIPGPLLVVLTGVGINKFFKFFVPQLYIDTQKVKLPAISGIEGFFAELTTFDLSGFFMPQVWVIAFTIAIIASLESLLSLEAADKIDPYKRISPPNRELIAQGTGNMINGLIGGLPLTAVIVRSSANITAGNKTKASAIFHGILLLVSAMMIPMLLNLIPLASLAAILLLIGYKLTKISLFKIQYKLGLDQFLPFIVTIVGIVFTDLLKGIGLGMAVAIVYIIMRNFKNSYFFKSQPGENPAIVHIMLAEEVSFLNKGALIKALDGIEDGKQVIIDGSNSKSIDYDVLEVIENFRINAEKRNITVTTIKVPRVLIGSLH
ncbi:SulP family inorganic anion transporter [Litoribacter ruber]|uniref:SulP family inorganic anion transporter n=1 Tax=Litoribacter ruber TaxID=702568 RepID=UPI001BD961A6|nr:SulP family inorganic anion transporter [Litoribacter ruber]MBT0811551.1 SulP family inorganic anion transporter [Litoribacter ruber]